MRSSGMVADPQHKIQWGVLAQLSPYFSEFKGRILLALVFLIMAKVSTIGMPFLLKMIVDSLTHADDPITNATLPSLPFWAVTPIALVIAYGLLRFCSVAFGELRDTLFSRVTERTIRRLSLKVFQHLHALDIEFHLDRRTGGLAREIDRGTSGISFIMRFMIFNIIPTLIEISLVVGILLFNYGISFGAVTFISIIVYAIFSIYTTNWRNKYVRAANEADSNSNTRAIDSLLNYETVKYFTNEKHESERYDHHLKTWENAKRVNRRTLFALNGGQALIISVAMTLLMYLAVEQVTAQQISVGDFVLINAFMMQLFMPLNFLGFIYREIRVALINVEKMLALLSRKPAITDSVDATPLSATNQPIYFKDIHFDYDKNRPILKGVNFSIPPKQTLAIVGSSGAGKSTLVKLLLRFYDPSQGQVLIGSQSISNVTQQSLRNNIGVVPQDTVLFNDTLLENIRYGKPSASDDEVNTAIKLAHIDSFIATLPKGLNTLVGERGLKLSGGEKQRVAIARALLKRPPILIFDEATSSLDSRSEAAILKAIEEISKNYTSLVIAHRLSTVVNADKIIVLEEGKIVESGNHQSLLKQNGLYSHLWIAQQTQNKVHSNE